MLPPDYDALSEQIVGDSAPDVLTLQAVGSVGHAPDEPAGASTAVATAPPRVQFTATAEMDEYALRQKTLVIRHTSDDRIVALVELLSQGNKASRHALRAFVEKAAAALRRGYHLLLVDLQPAGPRDPQGIHGALWSEISDDAY